MGKKKQTIKINPSSFHDLSHLITEDMPVYPGEPKPEFKPHFKLGKDKVNVSTLNLGSHTGTHIDAPKHFLLEGTSKDRIALEKFIGQAVILDLSQNGKGKGITDIDLEKYSDLIQIGDIVLLYTGTSEYWENYHEIRENFSYLEPSAATWIVNHKIKSVGIDSLSIEKFGFTEGTSHNILLSEGIGIIEGLNKGLKDFVGRRMFLVSLPLLLKGIDGSPARTILFDLV